MQGFLFIKGGSFMKFLRVNSLVRLKEDEKDIFRIKQINENETVVVEYWDNGNENNSSKQVNTSEIDKIIGYWS